MLILKPTKPEELYKFFTYGMPLNPTNISVSPLNCIRRKSWNALTDSDRDNWLLSITYYPNWKQDKPEWILTIHKYK